MWISFADEGLNQGPLHWEHEVLAGGPPGKFLKEQDSELSFVLIVGKRVIFHYMYICLYMQIKYLNGHRKESVSGFFS